MNPVCMNFSSIHAPHLHGFHSDASTYDALERREHSATDLGRQRKQESSLFFSSWRCEGGATDSVEERHHTEPFREGVMHDFAPQVW